MDDQRVWEFEGSLWDASDEHYQDRIDEEIVMVLPRPPYVFQGQEAKDAVKATPDWDTVELSDRRVSRPQEGLIVVAYTARCASGDEKYEALCTSTLRMRGNDDWLVVQHQQTPPLTASVEA
ncbi:DUF4440 domain-containing protein [Sphingomonas sp. PAMC26645]|uniref:DUF4440 domain-containing protein n=1 Tax=Sphingomonas sp. PAMC26645 TaxID=2565555 RepID=UPI00109DABAA|nr:DUF4440 domain-containing protein [Sphingomonas sp. PAMC26645]QCB43929.1 DUF4440 domain-containing protein [Sphingomonas sp. PAMC26645]